MKKFSCIVVCLAMATLTVFNSCRKPVDDIVTPGGSEKMTFEASIDDGAKVYLDGNHIKWASGDHIKINNCDFILKSGENTQNGKFENTGATPSSPYLAAQHGDNSKVTFDGESVQFTIPRIQNYTSEGQLNGAIPIAAYSSTMKLGFKSMVNVLKVNLTSSKSIDVSSVTVYSLKTDDSELIPNLCGKFNVNVVGNEPTPGVASVDPENPGQDLTSICNTTGFTLNGTKTLYFIVPVSSKTDNVIWIKVSSDAINRDAVKAVKLPSSSSPNNLFKIDFSVDMEYKYNVGTAIAPKYVVFSPGNLYCDMTDGNKVKFFESQTTLIPENTNNYPDIAHINHFYFNSENGYYACYANDAGNGILFTNNTATTSNENFTVNGEKGWRSLSLLEWKYLHGNHLYGLATVDVGENKINGMVKCPYGYPTWLPSDQYVKLDIGNIKNITEQQWNNMERLGVVFFPFAGCRESSISYQTPFIMLVSFVNEYMLYACSELNNLHPTGVIIGLSYFEYLGDPGTVFDYLAKSIRCVRDVN